MDNVFSIDEEILPPIRSYDEELRLRSWLFSEDARASAAPLRFDVGDRVLVLRHALVHWKGTEVSDDGEDALKEWCEAEITAQWPSIAVERGHCAPERLVPPRKPFVFPVVVEPRFAAYRVALRNATACLARDDYSMVRAAVDGDGEVERANALRTQLFKTSSPRDFVARRAAAMLAERIRWATMSAAEKSCAGDDDAPMRWDPALQRMVNESEEGRFVLHEGRTVEPLHRFRVRAKIRAPDSIHRRFPVDLDAADALRRPALRPGQTDVQRALRNSVTVPAWLQEQLRVIADARQGDALFKEGSNYVLLRSALSQRLWRVAIADGGRRAHLRAVGSLLDMLEDVAAAFDGITRGTAGTVRSRTATLRRLARLARRAVVGLRALKRGYTDFGHGTQLEQARSDIHFIIVRLEAMAAPVLAAMAAEGIAWDDDDDDDDAELEADTKAEGSEDAEEGAKEEAEGDAAEAASAEAGEAAAAAEEEEAAAAMLIKEEDDRGPPLSDLERLTSTYALFNSTSNAVEDLERIANLAEKYGAEVGVQERGRLFAKLLKDYGEAGVAAGEDAAYDARPKPPPPSRIAPLGDVTAYGTAVRVSAEQAIAFAEADAARSAREAEAAAAAGKRSPRLKRGASPSPSHSPSSSSASPAPSLAFWKAERKMQQLLTRRAWQDGVVALLAAPAPPGTSEAALQRALVAALGALCSGLRQPSDAPSPMQSDPCDEHGHFALYAAHTAVWKLRALVALGVDVNAPCTTFGTTLAFYHRNNVPTLRALEIMGLDVTLPINASGMTLSEYARSGRKVDLTRWLHEVELVQRYAATNELSERRLKIALASPTLAALGAEGVEQAWLEADRRKEGLLDVEVARFLTSQSGTVKKKKKRQGGIDFKKGMKRLGIRPERMKAAIARARRKKKERGARSPLASPAVVAGRAAGGSGMKAVRQRTPKRGGEQ